MEPEDSNHELSDEHNSIDLTDTHDEEDEPRVPLKLDPEFEDPNKGKYKYGIVYLSYVPEGLNVKLIKEILGRYGRVGRVYLEPEKNNKKNRTYVEGWVEFLKKKDAKLVAETLNGELIQFGKKRSKTRGQIWCIKYLHKFKWSHLIDQLGHDKAMREHRRRFEMSQAKKQVDFYQKMTERSRQIRKSEGSSRSNQAHPESKKLLQKRQKRPKDNGNEFEVPVDENLLESIFKRIS